MSLPAMLYSNWWENLEHPHSVGNQHFAHAIHPPFIPLTSQIRISPFTPTASARDILPKLPGSIYARPWGAMLRQGQSGTSTVKPDKHQFQVVLDVQQFAPDEISVKVVDRTVIVEGKHEEKQDEHGWISRQFCRRYMIPDQCDIDQVTSKLSIDGILSITVPRKDKPKSETERSITIEHTGKPAIFENGASKPVANDEAQEEK